MAKAKGVRRWGAQQPEAKIKRIERRAKRQTPAPDFEVRKIDANAPARAQLKLDAKQRALLLKEHQGPVTVSIEDIRDDTISVVRNTHMTFEEIRAAGGPHPTTLSKWLERVTLRPQLNTIRAALKACGGDLKVVFPTGLEQTSVEQTKPSEAHEAKS
jgi:hypothetical protein